ncbi:hypothetical protein EYF80_031927 [Liparis tanakae]|uniref:Uncharacterized protein n=1 Tax=Liparis tanakae TaxID=230148 RepID=A0A4Z2GXL3_9TELE|nr:hypothetical protein EYF80_031927 [Liparis tanakae]
MAFTKCFLSSVTQTTATGDRIPDDTGHAQSRTPAKQLGGTCRRRHVFSRRADACAPPPPLTSTPSDTNEHMLCILMTRCSYDAPMEPVCNRRCVAGRTSPVQLHKMD